MPQHHRAEPGTERRGRVGRTLRADDTGTCPSNVVTERERLPNDSSHFGIAEHRSFNGLGAGHRPDSGVGSDDYDGAVNHDSPADDNSSAEHFANVGSARVPARRTAAVLGSHEPGRHRVRGVGRRTLWAIR